MESIKQISTNQSNEIKDEVFTQTNQGFFSKLDPKDPRILDTIARQYGNKIMGLQNETKTLICCLLSKNLPKQYRMSVIISNQSSTGKSYLLNTVLEPFRIPNNQLSNPIIDYTDFTEAHFKRSQTDVDGKIIKIEQLERRDEKGLLSLQKLKHLLSEGRLKFGNVDNNIDGTRSPKDFEITGTPVIVTTTTEFKIDSETANRFLMMQLDESEEQTGRIINYTLQQYSSIRNNTHENSVEELRNLFLHYKELAHHMDEIVIPFAEKIYKVIPRTLEMRRDLKKILNLTCVIAFVHASHRDRFVSKKPKHFFTGEGIESKPENTYIIVARPDDLKIALEIAGGSIRQTINKSSQKLMEIDFILRELFNKKQLDSEGITVKEISEKSGLSDNRAREHLNDLCEKGYAGKDTSNKIHTYYPKEKKFSELEISEIEYSKTEYDEWVSSQLKLDEQYSFVPSCYETEQTIIEATSSSMTPIA